MATLNLGAIRYNWKGAYNGSTAYVVNDVVSANGNSYICIQAGTGQAVGNATAYWNIMSSAGTNGSNGSNGTDLTSTLTTRGDIVYKGASALTRLPKGTAGYYLKQGANDPEWGAVSPGGVIQFKHGMGTSVLNRTSDGYLDLATLTITPTSASNKILLHMQCAWGYSSGGNSPSCVIYPERAISGGATTQLAQDAVPSGFSNVGGVSSTENNNFGAEHIQSMSGQYVDATHNTTSAITYTLKFFVADGGSRTIYVGSSGQSTTNATYSARVPHIITAMEIGV